jgi:hypothetical protein
MLSKVMSNLIVMGKSPLILAALAKAAAPSLNFVKVQKLDALNTPDFDTALLTADDGKHFVIRIAETPTAATNHDAELRAVKALAKNASLPFAVTTHVASTTTRDGETARVLTYLYGGQFDVAQLAADDSLVESSAKALAAIHNLPLSLAQDIDAPEYTANQILRSCAAELDRAMETGKIPSVLLNRWEDALGHEDLFRFMPTVVNGMITDDSVLELDGEISAIANWSDLHIGDPARDFGWLMARGHEDLIYNALLAYQAARPAADDNIRQRAQLYSELAWASWLVSALNAGKDDDISEALGELEILAAQVEAGTAMRLIPSSFAPAIAQNFAEFAPSETETTLSEHFAASESKTDDLNSDDFNTDAFADTREPIFSSYNFDAPAVDFASTGANDEPAAFVSSASDTGTVVFDDEATAPIELPAFLAEEQPEAEPKDELF